METTRKLLSLRDIAAQVGVKDTETVKKWIDRGLLRGAVRVGRVIRVPSDAVDQMIARCQIQPEQAEVAE